MTMKKHQLIKVLIAIEVILLAVMMWVVFK
jgi:NADH:ubiquinone oxidoreductase subunit K